MINAAIMNCIQLNSASIFIGLISQRRFKIEDILFKIEAFICTHFQILMTFHENDLIQILEQNDKQFWNKKWIYVVVFLIQIPWRPRSITHFRANKRNLSTTHFQNTGPLVQNLNRDIFLKELLPMELHQN